MEISVDEAARVLGVGARRVRRLIADGRVHARRVGPIWVIDSTSLPRPRVSRPLSVRSAWALLLDEGAPNRHADRWRARRVRLAEDARPEVLLASWVASRGERRVYTTREPREVAVDSRVVASGLSDSRTGISAGEFAEGYVRTIDLDDIEREYLLRQSGGGGNVVLHVVEDLPPAPVPELVLAADLSEHDGYRETARARELIREVVHR